MTYKFLLLTVAILCISLAPGGAHASPAMLTVNSTGDGGDASPGDGVCQTATPGECTLRAAIQEANANPGTDTIAFNIPGAGSHTIRPASALPDIGDPVVVDGYTQPGASPNTEPLGSGTNAVLEIELDGTNAGAETYGLTLRIAGGTTIIRGLAINRFGGNGVLGLGQDIVLQGNFIGADVTGKAGLGNRYNGIQLDGTNGTIGGTAPEARNVISGNAIRGVFLGNATGVVIQGNLIGTDAAGTADLGNGEGVELYGGSNNTVGGTTAGAGNVISGNAWGVGIGYGETGALIEGNLIGTNAAGTAGLGNTLGGVVVYHGATSNTIGGTAVGAGNTIAHNGVGVRVEAASTTGNTVCANSIHSNGGSGIELLDGGNTELAPPIVDRADGFVTGHTSPKCYPCTVEIFSDSDGQGRTYHGSTSTNDDSAGTWTHMGAANGPNVTATVTDADGNTSEFSVPVPFPAPVGGVAEYPQVEPQAAMGDSSHAATRSLLIAGLAAGVIAIAATAWRCGNRLRG